jgi:hypothetical protein
MPVWGILPKHGYPLNFTQQWRHSTRPATKPGVRGFDIAINSPVASVISGALLYKVREAVPVRGRQIP